MNIFILDSDIKLSAQYHTDSHVVKMILESAQMLSTAVRLSGIPAGYKLTHSSHPCSIWCRESLDNWMYLKSLASYLNSEWQYRYNHRRNHKSFDVINLLPIPDIKSKGITPFALAMPDKYRKQDAVESYRKYYLEEKKHLFKWTNRSIPQWVKTGDTNES